MDMGLFGNSGDGFMDTLGGYVAGAKDAAGNALDAAGHALAYDALMGEVDKVLDNTALDGVLYDYAAPGPGAMGYGATPRSFAVKPAGWAALAALGVLAWMALK